MSTASSAIVQKLWNYCNVLRDDGLSYGDYVEQLTYLLFLKMADEREELYPNRPRLIPEDYNWASLCDLEGDALERQYRRTLENLPKASATLRLIFNKAQNRIQDPAKLRRLIADLIGQTTWSTLSGDVKGDAYEGLLEKNAADVKGGAGQYFTPRPLIRAIVECMKPAPGETIMDPAAGTGGFLLAAHKYIVDNNKNLSRAQSRHLRDEALRGVEIVDNTARLCAMNLHLHGIGGEEPPVSVADSLNSAPSVFHDLVMTNPPFGKKSSVTIINGGGQQARESLTVVRDDFWASTSNKQLNFLQHVRSLLKTESGRAAIVVPDNVLFEGGAGETIRRKLLQDCDVHTLLRLPTGIFYAQGVKANVLFFDRKPASPDPWTKKLWIYDFRTNQRFTLKTNSLKDADLTDFVARYNPGNRHRRCQTDCFRPFTYEELSRRDKCSLDIFWLKDASLEDSDNLPHPDEIAASIAEDLEAALSQFAQITEDLKP